MNNTLQPRLCVLVSDHSNWNNAVTKSQHDEPTISIRVKTMQDGNKTSATRWVSLFISVLNK